MVSIVVTELSDVSDVSMNCLEQRSQVSLRKEVLDIRWDTKYKRVVVIGANTVALESADSTTITIQDVLTALGHMEPVELSWIQDEYAGLALLKNPASVLQVCDPIMNQFEVKDADN
jgi:hypothetical protein